MKTQVKVFVCWSRPQSKHIAEAIYAHLPKFLPGLIDPFISTEDIEAGGRWMPDIEEELRTRHFGVVCLTPENISSQWVHFEAGAISSGAEGKARVCPYLFNLTPKELGGPLTEFTCVRATRDGTLKLIQAINNVADGREKLPDEAIDALFQQDWPALESRLKKAPDVVVDQRQPVDDDAFKDEVLAGIRLIKTHMTARVQGHSLVAGGATAGNFPQLAQGRFGLSVGSDGMVRFGPSGGPVTTMDVEHFTTLLKLAKHLEESDRSSPEFPDPEPPLGDIGESLVNALPQMGAGDWDEDQRRRFVIWLKERRIRARDFYSWEPEIREHWIRVFEKRDLGH